MTTIINVSPPSGTWFRIVGFILDDETVLRCAMLYPKEIRGLLKYLRMRNDWVSARDISDRKSTMIMVKDGLAERRRDPRRSGSSYSYRLTEPGIVLANVLLKKRA